MQANNIKHPVFHLLDVTSGSIEKIACDDDIQFYQNINKILHNKIVHSDKITGTNFAGTITRDFKTNLDENDQNKIFIKTSDNDKMDNNILSGIVVSSKLKHFKMAMDETSSLNPLKEGADNDQTQDFIFFTKPFEIILEKKFTECMDISDSYNFCNKKNSFACEKPFFIAEGCEENQRHFSTILFADSQKNTAALVSSIKSNNAAISIEEVYPPTNQDGQTKYSTKDKILTIDNDYLFDMLSTDSGEDIFPMSGHLNKYYLGTDFVGFKYPNDSISKDFKEDVPEVYENSPNRMLLVPCSTSKEIHLDNFNSSSRYSLLAFSIVKNADITASLDNSIIEDTLAIGGFSQKCPIILPDNEKSLPKQEQNLLSFCPDLFYTQDQGKVRSVSTSLPFEIIADIDNPSNEYSPQPYSKVVTTNIGFLNRNSIIPDDLDPLADIKEHTVRTDNFSMVRPVSFDYLTTDKIGVSGKRSLSDNIVSADLTLNEPVFIPKDEKSDLQLGEKRLHFNLKEDDIKNNQLVLIDKIGIDRIAPIFDSKEDVVGIDNQNESSLFLFLNFTEKMIDGFRGDSVVENDFQSTVNINELAINIDDISFPWTSPFLFFTVDGKGMPLAEHHEKDTVSKEFTQTNPIISIKRGKSPSQHGDNLLSIGFYQLDVDDKDESRVASPLLFGIEIGVSKGIKNITPIDLSLALDNAFQPVEPKESGRIILDFYIDYKMLGNQKGSGHGNIRLGEELFPEKFEQNPFLNLVPTTDNNYDTQLDPHLASESIQNLLFIPNDELNFGNTSLSFVDIDKLPIIDKMHPLISESPGTLTHSMDRKDCFVDAEELCPIFLESEKIAVMNKPHSTLKADISSEQDMVDSTDMLGSTALKYGVIENTNSPSAIVQTVKNTDDASIINPDGDKNYLNIFKGDLTSNNNMPIQRLIESQHTTSLNKDSFASFDIGSVSAGLTPIMSEQNTQNNLKMFPENFKGQSDPTAGVLLISEMLSQLESSVSQDIDPTFGSDLMSFKTLGSENERPGLPPKELKISENNKLSATDYSQLYRFEAYGKSHVVKSSNNLLEKKIGDKIERVGDSKNLNCLKDFVSNQLFDDTKTAKSIIEDQNTIDIKYGLTLKNSNENLEINTGIKLGQLATKSPEERQLLIEKTIMDQVISKTRVEMNEGNPEIRIEIKPKMFGNIKIHVLKENHQIIANVIAENSYVKELIERQIHLLRNELHDQRIEVREINVSINKESENFNSQSNNQPQTDKRPTNFSFFGTDFDDDHKEDNLKPVNSKKYSDEKNIDFYA